MRVYALGSHETAESAAVPTDRLARHVESWLLDCEIRDASLIPHPFVVSH